MLHGLNTIQKQSTWDIYNYSNGYSFKYIYSSNRSQSSLKSISFHSRRLNQRGKKSKSEILDLSQLCHVCLDHLMGTSISDTNFWWKWNGKSAFEQSLYLGDGLQGWSIGSLIVWEMVVKSIFTIPMFNSEQPSLDVLDRPLIDLELLHLKWLHFLCIQWLRMGF